MKNNWISRIIRQFTALLPISKKRIGKCVHCGACCKLPNVCPFLKYDENNGYRCKIYIIRPLTCRKYPRTIREQITKDTCGFKFHQ